MNPGKLLTLLLLAYCFVNCCANQAYSQEINLEDRIPRELLSKNEKLAILQQELRQVRRNFSKLGKKHPSWASTNDRIGRLEKQILAIIDQVDESHRQKQPEKVPAERPMDLDRVTKEMPEQKPPIPSVGPSDIGEPKGDRRLQTEDPWSRWESNTQEWISDSMYEGYDQIALQLVNPWDIGSRTLAYPYLRSSRLDSFGFSQDGQVVWGVENDRLLGVARVWTWENKKEVRRKELLCQTVGEVLEVLIPDEYSINGTWYAVKRDVAKHDSRFFQVVSVGKPDHLTSMIDRHHEETVVSFTVDPRVRLDRLEPRLAIGLSGVKFLTTGIGFSVEKPGESSKLVYGKQIDPLTYCFDKAEKAEDVRQAAKRWIAISAISDNRAYETLRISKKSILQREKASQFETLGIRSWELADKHRVEKHSIRLQSELKEALMADDAVYFSSDGGHKIYATGISTNKMEEFNLIGGSSSRSASMNWSKENGLTILGSQGIEALKASKESPLVNFEEINLVSKLGIFKDTRKRIVSDWLIPYEIKLEKSPHGSTLEHYLGLPRGKQIEALPSGNFVFPDGTVFVSFFGRTPVTPFAQEANFDLNLFYKVASGWIGLRYRWKDDWSDALLVQSEPFESSLSGKKQSTQEVLSTRRDRCWDCHRAESNGGVLGFEPGQLRAITKDDRLQEASLVRIGVIRGGGVDPAGLDSDPEEFSDILSQMRSVLRGKLVDALTKDSAQRQPIFGYFETYLCTGDERLLDRGREMIQEMLISEPKNSMSMGSDSIDKAEANSIFVRSLFSGYSTTGDLKMLSTAGRIALSIRPKWDERQDMVFHDVIGPAEVLLDYCRVSASGWALDDLEFAMEVLERQLRGPGGQEFRSSEVELTWLYRYWRLLRRLKVELQDSNYSSQERQVSEYLWDKLREADRRGLIEESISTMLQLDSLKHDRSQARVKSVAEVWQSLKTIIDEADMFGMEGVLPNNGSSQNRQMEFEILLDLLVDAIAMDFSTDEF